MDAQATRRPEAETSAGEILGSNEGMYQLLRQARAVAPLDATVLLTGETGSGKGHLARTLHRMSPREALPFVHVDCAALSPTLIESELFGHEKGAFTSAASRRVGRFETAARGTVFLDEIGDLEPGLQSKLLRVLDDREFERIGGVRTLSMNARVVAATSRNLREAVSDGRFRPDLYFRLAVFHLRVPPLRERREDIPALVAYGLQRLARRRGLPPFETTTAVHAELMQHSWPGNVRELMNVLERLAAQQPGPLLDAHHLEGLIDDWPASRAERRPGPASRGSLLELLEQLCEAERGEILAALEWSRGNVTGAARRLCIPRSTLRHRMRKHAL
jgi:DNA-binding NtrC family response regulator